MHIDVGLFVIVVLCLAWAVGAITIVAMFIPPKELDSEDSD